MTQTTAEQRAELADLLRSIERGGGYWDEQGILELVPALLADAEALAAREADDAAGDPPIVTPAVPSREVTVRIVGRGRVVSAKYEEESDHARDHRPR